MAVVVRHGRDRPRVMRALRRARVPVTFTFLAWREEPAVQALVDVVDWASGDGLAGQRLATSVLGGLGPERLDTLRRELAGHHGDRPDEASVDRLADRLWRLAFAPRLVRPAGPKAEPWTTRALDVVATVLSELRVRAQRDPGWRWGQARAWLGDHETEIVKGPGGVGDGVEVLTAAEAGGQQWDTVVLVGAVEGQWPAATGPAPLFDALLVTDRPPRTRRERAELISGRERRLFAQVVGMARRHLVGVAAVAPGVRLSRFVEHWPISEPSLPALATPCPTPRAPTVGEVPVSPTGKLVLSASQLATYDDCPLRYAFQYPLGARPDPNVWADMGSYIHGVLAEFTGQPAGDHSWKELEATAERRWSDQLARYRPQRDEIRREAFEMFKKWWESEWAAGDPPVIVAVERAFDIPVGPHRVVGRIDRIEQTDDGVVIVDYKTGSRIAASVDPAGDLQLGVYHLAAVTDPELAALGSPVGLRLRYLRRGVDLSQPVTPDLAEQTTARVLETARRILAEEFDPSPAADCDTCPFQRLCPLQEAGREVSA
jgi:RecB family exonuclease